MRRFTGRAARAALLGVAVLGAPAAHAQGGRTVQPSPAEVAQSTGNLDETERALYAVARRAPRDPAARGALGAWLASRGALRIGAVLLEEARLFGGEPHAIAARLEHVYAWLHDWSSLAALPGSSFSGAEKKRAQMLADLGTDTQGADTVQVTFAPLEVGALGRVPMLIGRDTLWGEVDPQVEGLVLPGLGRGVGLVDVIGEDAKGEVAIVRELTLGVLTLRNVPARLDASLGVGRARLGFDVFASLAPTVDARAGVVTLRRGGKVALPAAAVAVPMVLGFPGVRLAARRGEPLAPITSPSGRMALRGHPWTVDVRRGTIWVDTAR
ncbi:MAG: hypothetical protein ACYC3L_02080 [Gemmatimonadaceae bacterium]